MAAKAKQTQAAEALPEEEELPVVSFEEDEPVSDQQAAMEEASKTAMRTNPFDAEDVIEKACAQALDQAPRDIDGSLRCPWCGYSTMPGDDDAQRAALKLHWMKNEQSHLFAFHALPDLGFEAYATLMRNRSAKDEAMARKEMGIDVVDELDDFDYLAVPPAVKEKARALGGRVRWVSQDNIERYRKRGMQVLDTSGHEFQHNHRHETSTASANELTLMYIPPQVAARIDGLKKLRVQQQSEGLLNMGEASPAQLDDVGRALFERYKAQGMNDRNAFKVAQNALQKISDNGTTPRGVAVEGVQSRVTTGTGPIPQ